MAKRSPILGYNHNISHRGLVFHVQTEDSGVDHPHIFTHLFMGGVIVNTRKLDYDAESTVEAVKSLMQAQHKSILKGLKRGDFDPKIEKYFGDNPDLQPVGAQVAEGSAPQAAEPEPEAETAAEADGPSDVSEAFETIKQEELTEPTPAPVAAAPVAAPEPAVVRATPGSPGTYSQRHAKPERVSAPRGVPAIVHEHPTMPVQRGQLGKRPAGKQASISERAGEAGRRATPSVVVSRPAVIIGAPSKVVGGQRPAAANPAARPRPRRFAREEAGGQGLFGKDMISEKSLDEVILAYLSEDSNEE